jgi:hypothetical protein
MKFASLCLVLILLIPAAGCSHRIVNNPSTTYDSMGMIEEKVPVDRAILKYVTLGLMRKHSYKSLTKKLNRRLDSMAHEKYGADAVNNIQYWPGPDSDALVDFLYARGEMIKFRKFASHTDAHQAAAS